MLLDTINDNEKVYAEDDFDAWTIEFQVIWADSGGEKLDRQLETEYASRVEKSKQIVQSQETSEEAAPAVPEPAVPECKTWVEPAVHDAWAVCDPAPVGEAKAFEPLSTPPPDTLPRN